MTRTAAFPGGRSKSVAITERVEADLRSRILAGELHPKERIVAGDIAKRLNVNRGTVREALLRLESYEMVFSIPAYGTFIRDISPQEIDLIFRMRAKLESLCVQYIHENQSIAPEQLLKIPLRNLKKAAAKNCEERFFIADRRLHSTIWRAANQPLLFRALSSLMNPCTFVLAHGYSSRIPLAERYRNHEDYVRLIAEAPSVPLPKNIERHLHELFLAGV
jgi:DNA-binding GntR family transcriptional regulator